MTSDDYFVYYIPPKLHRGGQTDHPHSVRDRRMTGQPTGMKAFEQDPETRPCGCIISKPSAAGNRVIIEKCEEAKRLWDALILARDRMREGEGRGYRKGHKKRIDKFASARGDYHAHVFGRTL